MLAAALQHQVVVQHDGALAVAICEREPESKALLSADRGMSLAARRQRTGLGRCDKVLLKQRPAKRKDITQKRFDSMPRTVLPFCISHTNR